MTTQTFRSKNKFAADGRFVAGHAALEFVKGANASWTEMIIRRVAKVGGALVEAKRETIPAEMVESLCKKLKPYTAN